jgi:hypothetical protein
MIFADKAVLFVGKSVGRAAIRAACVCVCLRVCGGGGGLDVGCAVDGA